MGGIPESAYSFLAEAIRRISSRRRLDRSPPIADRSVGPCKCPDARDPLASLSLDQTHWSALVWIWLGEPVGRDGFFGHLLMPAVGSQAFSEAASPGRRGVAL